MREENLLPVSDGTLFKFELPLTLQALTEESPQRPKDEVIAWLNDGTIGKFQYIFDMGDLVGISFEREEDAVQFKITWL